MGQITTRAKLVPTMSQFTGALRTCMEYKSFGFVTKQRVTKPSTPRGRGVMIYVVEMSHEMMIYNDS